MSGIRDSKTVDGVEYNYLTLDGKVKQHEIWLQALCDAKENANRELESILGEEDFSSLSGNRQNRPDMFSDPQIMDIIMYVIHELNAEGEIRCKCPEGHGHYAVDILDEGVKISCEDCGASTIIPTDSIVSANAFLHCTHIDLE